MLDDALDRKIRYAEAHGIELFVVSQFCFDGQLVLDWLDRLRNRGVTLPVRVGAAGPGLGLRAPLAGPSAGGAAPGRDRRADRRRPVAHPPGLRGAGRRS